MQATVDRKQFMEGLTIAAAAAAKRSVRKALTGVKITASVAGSSHWLTLHATDLEVAVETVIPDVFAISGSIVLADPANVMKWLKKMDTEQVCIQDTKITAGSLSLPIQTFDAKEFPEFPKKPDVRRAQIDGTKLHEVLGQVAFCASSESTRYAINGVHFCSEAGCLTVVATDGRRLAYLKTTVDSKMEPIIVSSETVELVSKLTKKTKSRTDIYADDKTIFFQIGNTAIAGVLVEGIFPRYQNVIPKGAWDSSTKLNREALFRQLEVLAPALDPDDKLCAVRLGFESDKLTLCARNKGENTFSGAIDARMDLQKILSFNVNHALLMEVAKNSICDDLRLYVYRNVVTFASDQARYVFCKITDKEESEPCEAPSKTTEQQSQDTQDAPAEPDVSEPEESTAPDVDTSSTDSSEEVKMDLKKGDKITVIYSNAAAFTSRQEGKFVRLLHDHLDMIPAGKRKEATFPLRDRTMVFRGDPMLRVDSEYDKFHGNALINLTNRTGMSMAPVIGGGKPEPLTRSTEAIKETIEKHNLNPNLNKALILVWTEEGIAKDEPIVLYPEAAQKTQHAVLERYRKNASCQTQSNSSQAPRPSSTPSTPATTHGPERTETSSRQSKPAEKQSAGSSMNATSPNSSSQGASGTSSAHIEKHNHQKKGFDYHLVVPHERVSSEEWRAIVERAKALGGWYSRAYMQIPGGYAFKEEEKAKQFLAQEFASSAPEAKPEPVPEPAPEESPKIIIKEAKIVMSRSEGVKAVPIEEKSEAITFKYLGAMIEREPVFTDSGLAIVNLQGRPDTFAVVAVRHRTILNPKLCNVTGEVANRGVAELLKIGDWNLDREVLVGQPDFKQRYLRAIDKALESPKPEPEPDPEPEPKKEEPKLKWKCGVRTGRDPKLYFNMLTFDTKEQAEAYGRDLFSRWTAMESYEAVLETEQEAADRIAAAQKEEAAEENAPEPAPEKVPETNVVKADFTPKPAQKEDLVARLRRLAASNS